MKEKKDRWKKSKRICHWQTYPQIMAKGNSLNKNESWGRGGILEHKGGRKNMVSKNMGKYTKHLLNFLNYVWMLK